MAEIPIMKDIMLEAPTVGARLFRNNNGTLQDRFGNYVTYGMGKGTSDLIGLVPIVVTQEMVGKTVGIFLAVEAKDPKGHTKKALLKMQKDFLTAINFLGGIGFIANSVDEFLEKLNERRKT